MLVITVKQGEHVTLTHEPIMPGPRPTTPEDPVIVRVLEAHEGKVKFGVDAPGNVKILRSGAKSGARNV